MNASCSELWKWSFIHQIAQYQSFATRRTYLLSTANLELELICPSQNQGEYSYIFQFRSLAYHQNLKHKKNKSCTFRSSISTSTVSSFVMPDSWNDLRTSLFSFFIFNAPSGFCFHQEIQINFTSTQNNKYGTIYTNSMLKGQLLCILSYALECVNKFILSIIISIVVKGTPRPSAPCHTLICVVIYF